MPRTLRIAQVSPLIERVPPETYGGTERVVSYLTERLVDEGHQVTLFASGDSITKANLCSVCRRALRLDPSTPEPLIYHYLLMEAVLREARRFDIIHFHLDYLAYPFLRRIDVPHVTTLHGRLDLPELPALYHEYPDVPVVSISDAQRRPLPRLLWKATVPHGLPLALHRLGKGAGGYLAFLGRVSRDKRLDRAIAIAKEVGMPLRVAAKVDKADSEYFETELKPILRVSPHVEFIGEIDEREKSAFLGDALALLFPIDWPEPFGMVMIEAMACGTPVVAYEGGSVDEVIDEGETGFVVRSRGRRGIEEAAAAVRRAGVLDRRRCRKIFEARFSDLRMARDYLRVYRRIIAEHPAGRDGDSRRKEGRGRDYPTERPVLRPGDLFAS